jgi:cell division protein FtsW (lipid II flippase)
VVGATVVHAHGVAPVAFLPNAIALAVGAAGFLWLTRPSRRPARSAAAIWPAVAAALAIAATLAAPGIAGVHRWLPLGPLISDGDRRRRWLGLGLAGAMQVIHLAQPDAGQATALALGTLPLVADGDRRGLTSLGSALLLSGPAIAVETGSWASPGRVRQLPEHSISAHSASGTPA